MKTCFIIMPISTPDHYVNQYKGDPNHFIHVLDHLFKPAITAAGLDPIPPISKGSSVIHGDIIRNVETADLVLCDMSILNPNVFFELGIRTALNKSVAIVKDDVTPKIPFDTGIINHHTYDSLLAPWVLESQVELMMEHLESCMKNGSENALWSYFSMSQQAEVPKDAPVVEKQLSYLVQQMESLRGQINSYSHSSTSEGIESDALATLMGKILGILRGVNIDVFKPLHYNGGEFEICTTERLPEKERKRIVELCLSVFPIYKVIFINKNRIYQIYDIAHREGFLP